MNYFLSFVVFIEEKKNVLINKSKIVVIFNNCIIKVNMVFIFVIYFVDDIIKCMLDYIMYVWYFNDNWI